MVSNQKNNDNSATVEVVYLTTQPKHDLPTHVIISSLSRESIAICEQITTVAIERMGNYRGQVTGAEMSGLEIAMAISLGMQPCGSQEDVCEAATDEQLAAVKAKCAMLQQMYDALLDKLLRSGR
ncbi:MAG: type II toxin-antitoxin system PemK/MazF family toxin [Bacteroides sp.]